MLNNLLLKIRTDKKYLLLSLLLLTLIVYFPTLFFQYVYLDDYLMVQEPGFHNNLKNIPGSFFRSIWPYSSSSTYQYYRPVSISLYILGTWISQQISSETLPWIFHLTNIALQISVVALFFEFLLLMGASISFAGIASVLFIVHPALAGTICWIPGQNELLLAVFILSAFMALIKYVKTSKNKWLYFHILFYWLAILTKENGIILPILAVIYLLSVRYPLQRIYKILAGWILAIGAWFSMLKLGAGLNNPVTENVLSSIIEHLHYSLVYLGKIFVPYPLTTLPTFHDTSYFIIGAGALALLFFAILFFVKKNKWLTLLGIAWFFGFLLPTFSAASSQGAMNFILREDRIYLASIGVWIVFLQASWPKQFLKSKATIIGIIAFVFLNINYIHQQNYSSGIAFYSDAAKGSPNLAFAHAHLGDMHLTAKEFEPALQSYKKAIMLNPYEPQAHNNLGVAYMRMGRIDLAIKEFETELTFYPKNILALFNLGSLRLQRNQLAEAEVLFRRAVKVNPVYTDAWQGLGAIYTIQNNEKGLEEVKKGLAQSEWDMSKGL